MADEQQLIQNFDIMVSEESARNESTNIFEGWSDEKKVNYMNQLEFNLPEHTEAANLENMQVPDSVLCDVTSAGQAKQNYVSSIGHFRSWQYAGSDRRFEFGSKRERTFVTRSSGTFVFYFQCDDLLVGLIIDGQRGWAEGAITRNLRDGRETVLQFSRKPPHQEYIRSKKTYTVKYDGNYTKGEKIYKIKLGVWQLRRAIMAIGGFVPGVSKCEPEPVHWQILVLFAPEAGRLNYVFGQTSNSLSVDDGVVIQILPDIEPFVLSYLKLSRCAIAALDGDAFIHVKGTTPRNLYQILLAVLILRRNVVYPTHFMLPDAPPPMRDGPDQGNRGNALIGEQKLKYDNAKGTTYQVGKHDGTATYSSEEWLTHPFEKDEQSNQERHQIIMLLVFSSVPVALGIDNSKVSEIMKKRAITTETGSMDAHNKKAKLMVVEHEQRCYVTEGNLCDKTSGFHASFEDDAHSRTICTSNASFEQDAHSRTFLTTNASFEEDAAYRTVLTTNGSFEEDAGSRTVLTTNVHFAATKEVFPMHLMERHAKGAAYVTCADKQSVEKPTSLTLGTSFFSRYDTQWVKDMKLSMRVKNDPAITLVNKQWVKDMKLSMRVKNDPAIALVNKATGEALKHSLGHSHPVMQPHSREGRVHCLPLAAASEAI